MLALIGPAGTAPAESEGPPEPSAPEAVAPPEAAAQPEPVAQAPSPPQAPVAPPPSEPTPQPVAAAPVAETPAPPEGSGNGRTFVSPVVARIAAEHGVDPGAITGTGTGRSRDEEGHPRLHRVRRGSRRASGPSGSARRGPRIRRARGRARGGTRARLRLRRPRPRLRLHLRRCTTGSASGARAASSAGRPAGHARDGRGRRARGADDRDAPRRRWSTCGARSTPRRT